MDSSRRAFLKAGAGAAAAAWTCWPASGQTPDLSALTLKRASELLRSKAVSSVDLTEACLKRIEQYNRAITEEHCAAAAGESDR